MLLGFILVSCQLHAQLDTIPLGKVTYSHQVHPSEVPSKNGVAELYFNNSRSLYRHLGFLEEQGESYPDPSGMLIKSVGGDKQGAPIYKMHPERKLLYRSHCVGGKGRYIVSDTLGGIEWVLHPEHKRFGPYDCRRATGVFHGREYEAWYSLELPVPSGPFKLGGLPGLILDARTTDGTAEFSFVSIEISNTLQDRIKPPFGKDSGLNYMQYEKARWAYSINQVAEFNAKGMNITIFKDPSALELWKPDQ